MLCYATEAGGVCGSVHGELTFFPPYPDGLVAPTWGQQRPVGAPADEPAAGVRVCTQPLNQGQSLLHGRAGKILPSRCHWQLAEKRDRKWPEAPKADREQQQHYSPKPQSTTRARIQKWPYLRWTQSVISTKQQSAEVHNIIGEQNAAIFTYLVPALHCGLQFRGLFFPLGKFHVKNNSVKFTVFYFMSCFIVFYWSKVLSCLFLTNL